MQSSIEAIKNCNSCNSEQYIKAGMIRGKQRYQCKACHKHFVAKDQRIRISKDDCLRAVKFCSMNVSFNAVAEMFRTSRTSLRRWMKQDINKASPYDKVDQLRVKLWKLYSQKKYKQIRPSRHDKLMFRVDWLEDKVNHLSKCPVTLNVKT